MNRRRFVGSLMAAAGATVLGGHTPYGHWVVYRRKHLLVGCHRADPRTYDLARRTVSVLGEHLPEARARVARAPDARRIASLLGTGQMEFAILSTTDATAMAAGSGPFRPYGEIALRLLAPVADRVLVAVADVPDRHAWLVTGALAGTALVPVLDSGDLAGISWHTGSLAFRDGRPEPVE